MTGSAFIQLEIFGFWQAHILTSHMQRSCLAPLIPETEDDLRARGLFV